MHRVPPKIQSRDLHFSQLISYPLLIQAALDVKQVSTSDIIQTRTYDLSITYDKYYQTPRLWLTGYNEVYILII